MGWDIVRIEGLLRSNTSAASGALFSLGAVGVQESWLEGTAPRPMQPWDTGPPPPEPDRHVLTAWFDTAERGEIAATLSPWLDAHTTLGWGREDDRDWVAENQATFVPIQVGALTIAPPWDAPEGALLIEPGAGFGTGDHPTTRQALLLFENTTGRTALDIGCGSGVLALAAARRGLTAHGIDIQDSAVTNARKNAALNGLEATFDTATADQLEPADVVFGNLHAELIIQLASDLKRLTRGSLILAGIIDDREARVREAIPWTVVDRIQDGEWVALHLQP